MGTRKEHWEDIYTTRPPDSVSWYREHLETSLAWIERVAPERGAAILDVGGGQSSLVDDLLALGYTDVSVLDLSEIAVEATRQRLGAAAGQVTWLAGDICEIAVAPSRYDVWHDRAVFHFLTLAGQRATYAGKAAASIKPGGRLILSTFGPDGPTRCSGLDTMRYDAAALEQEISSGFRLTDSLIDWHTTPTGGKQQFLYCMFERIERDARPV